MQDDTEATAVGSGPDRSDIADSIADALARSAGALNVAILTAMTVVVFASVIARYAFNAGLPWSEEFAIWGFTWLIFIGVALGVRGNRHVAVDILLDLLGPRLRPTAELLRDTLVAMALFALTFSGYKLAAMVGGVSTGLHWPNALRYAVIPGAGALALVFFLTNDTGHGLKRRAATMLAGALLYTALQHPALSPLGQISPGLVMVAAFFIALALGVPVAFAMLLGVTLTTWTGGLLPAPAIMQNMAAGSSKFILLAIPFFLTTGYLLNIGGLSTRLIDFAVALCGHMRGGLAQVNVINSVLVGGISGSSGADAASTTKVLVPQMVKRGYPADFSCAITAVSSTLPNVLPPAIAMLVYASVSNVSVAKLFVGGILTGLLIAAALMTANALIARRRGYESATTRAPLSVVWRSFLRALPALAIAIVVLGCIRFGITTATEAGVIALVWALILGKFVFRECSWRQLYASLEECSIDSALIGFLIAAQISRTAPQSVFREVVPLVLVVRHPGAGLRLSGAVARSVVADRLTIGRQCAGC
ncbi:TRAP transporter large permease [Puniceibacterium confluentis]|uniref:TRAP transporter large permease n=1 Tax=Puniceibacterium confluentis TaxID=1958944 RepID=UPI0011B6D2F0|nr:TRAP transporter large permease subunit [Puniceibacterium confluentis]